MRRAIWLQCPDSRSAIFKDRILSFTEKNQLMRFFKLVQGHFLSESEGDQCDRISEEDLESPFVEFLTKLGISQKLKWIILYAIVMANYDQDNKEVCKDVIKTKDGINHLTLHHSSVGRFPNANGAMIYPLYGQGELPQAFCRRAAVKGCIHVLRMPVIALLMDKDSGTYKGVKLVSGQELFSPQLILAPSFTITSPLVPFSSHKLSSHDLDLQDIKEKVARAICITTNSLKPDVANCLVFFPPRSLCPDQTMSVRVFQLSSNVAVCPSGMFVTYLSAVCDSAVEGKKLLHSAINSLFSVSSSGKSEKRAMNDQSENTDVKPSLLWSALYLQELTTGAFESINYMTMPDEHLHYNSLLDTTAKLFQKMYPGEEFFPTTNLSDEFADDETFTKVLQPGLCLFGARHFHFIWHCTVDSTDLVSDCTKQASKNGCNLQPLHRQQIRRPHFLQGLWVSGKNGHQRQLETGKSMALDACHLSAALPCIWMFGNRAPTPLIYTVFSLSPVSDEEVEAILPTAAYALAKIHMHLVSNFVIQHEVVFAIPRTTYLMFTQEAANQLSSCPFV
ncbi:Rab escort protein [Abeliophyllum distichum]|uniref:Rab escort protein n=1 Tax=Abeliophyllum distichum TaxID=126358 RepID=A0ABD1RS09_9LAMI